jgi:hypothetical protein
MPPSLLSRSPHLTMIPPLPAVPSQRKQPEKVQGTIDDHHDE